MAHILSAASRRRKSERICRAYMAGRTTRVGLGSMVVVLPWHDPIRVADEVAFLDHVSGGRALFGMGRGLGRIEFDGFRVDMNESRERFVEYAEAILEALENGTIEYDGAHYKQPPAAIRPRPFKSFRGRTYAAAVSPASAAILARLGIGVLIIAQKPWDKAIAELDAYRESYREHQGHPAPQPIIASFIACHEEAAVAEEMHQKYIRAYSRSALDHYEFDNPGLADIRGYEYYGALSRNIEKHGVESFVNFLADLQVWGTPEQCFERIMEQHELAGTCGLIGAFSYGGMPHEIAESNMRLFADKVLPRLKAVGVETIVGGDGETTMVAAK